MRSLLVAIHDICAAALAWIVAYWLRFNFDLPAAHVNGMLGAMPLVVSVQALSFYKFGLYQGIWRFASLPDLKRIIYAVGLSSIAIPAVLLMFSGYASVPRSVLVLQPMMLVLFMGGARFAYRAWKDGHFSLSSESDGNPVLILGAGEAGVSLARELSGKPEWNVVGFIDDDSSKHGRRVGDVTVYGGTDSLSKIVMKLGASHAIVAMPALSVEKRRKVVESAIEAGLEVLTVPPVEDILSGRVSISQIRRVQLEDLLGRDPVELDNSGLSAWLGDQVVLVTGAGGSIGSELVRQIAQFRPGLLILLELSEFALYQIEQEFAQRFAYVPIACVVGDVKDAGGLERVFANYRPSVVFHAAAYKHVPLMEGENAWQAVRNNVLGSKCLAEAAQRHGVEKMVLISTDKAVNPTNVMGATKRLAERVLSSLQEQGSTRFITVRFGNVLGSNGSVIPKFREQIARGGPVTVTHPEIIRYFMLIPEAAQLVLQAGLMGQGGEIFVLEMGEPVRIADLARDMIRLSGFAEEEIRIEFTGLRPGEKLYEELLTDQEHTLPTPHPKLRVAQAEAAPGADWQSELENWLGASVPDSANELKRKLKGFVPEYSPELN